MDNFFFGFREPGAIRANKGIEEAFDGASSIRSLYEEAVRLLRGETVIGFEVIGGGHKLLSGGFGYLLVVNAVVQNYLPDGVRLPDLEVLNLRDVVADLKRPIRPSIEERAGQPVGQPIAQTREEFRGLSEKALGHLRDKRIKRLTPPEMLLWRLVSEEELIEGGLPLEKADFSAELARLHGWVEIDEDQEGIFLTEKGSAIAIAIESFIEKGVPISE